jgi:hypothetical protein
LAPQERPARDAAVDRLIGMLRAQFKRSEKKQFRLALFMGIDCWIERGGQNLPGNWESSTSTCRV